MQQLPVLGQYALGLFQHLGYTGLAIALLLNTMGIPLPSEIILPITGLAVRDGGYNFWLIVLVAVIAQIAGAIFAYSIGRRGGVPLIKRYGRYVLLSQNDLVITNRWFQRYGTPLAFVGYILPVLRGYIGYVAGIAEMPLERFLPMATLGILAWTVAMVGLGYSLAGNLAAIEAVMRPFSLAIILVIVVAIVYFIWHRLKGLKT